MIPTLVISLITFLRLMFINRTGTGVALCVFIHKCYWYVVDVFVGIDEKHGFDPRFIIFVALTVLAFVLAEAAIYLRKTKDNAPA